MTEDQVKNESPKVEQQEKKNYSQLLSKRVPIKDIVEGSGLSKLKVEEEGMYEIIDLPSRGWPYPETSLLSSGRMKVKIPTGEQEAILSSQNLIRKGIMIDQFLKAVILDSIDVDDMVLGDKNYLLFAARRLAYGNEYKAKVQCSKCSAQNDVNFNLNQFLPKQTPELFKYPKGTTVFQFITPQTKRVVHFKLNTGKIEKIVDKRLQITNLINLQILIRLSCMIEDIDGLSEFNEILSQLRKMSSKETSALRQYIKSIQPDINVQKKIECKKCFRQQEVTVPMTVDFFWPAL